MTGLHQELGSRRAEGALSRVLQASGDVKVLNPVESPLDISAVRPGDVVALLGDFSSTSIATLIALLDLATVVVPLTIDTRSDHPYFFAAALVDVIVDAEGARRIRDRQSSHPLIDALREQGRAGLVLFSSGTTGRPKAALHDFERFRTRYRAPRPTLRTLAFLRFDHIGGLNTLFHTLYNGGDVVVPAGYGPADVLDAVERFGVELLPTTPTFLRMLRVGGLLNAPELASLRLITHGTERMDPATLRAVCDSLPRVDVRQTYGLTELGILRVRSERRDSLWIQIGGDGVESRVVDGVLHIRSPNRMLGYLNAPQPFIDGWYDTGDSVVVRGDYLRITGRLDQVINVGGVKVLPDEVERIALAHESVLRCRAEGRANPITGQHVLVTCQLASSNASTAAEVRRYLAARLPPGIGPVQVIVGEVPITHRMKQR